MQIKYQDTILAKGSHSLSLFLIHQKETNPKLKKEAKATLDKHMKEQEQAFQARTYQNLHT